MHPDTIRHDWERYREDELRAVVPFLTELGFEIDLVQPHIGGERYLMQNVTTPSGKKLILYGRRGSDARRVVIKVTRDENGKRELRHERRCREMLHHLEFAYHVFYSPEELLFVTRGDFLISIQAYIAQECSFLSRPLPEQFSYALRAFKAQESAHVTTYGHAHDVTRVFGMRHAATYLDTFATFMQNSFRERPTDTILHAALAEALIRLQQGRTLIEQYSGFLTHTDFVPHNIRIHDEKIFLLDHSSLLFGNKYDGWARFINFMTLYNPSLSEALTDYVRLNRTPEEVQVLSCMRLYRLGEIIWYYISTLERSAGNLLTLNEARVTLWTQVLTAVLQNERVSETVLAHYRAMRDTLRSDDEKLRQKDLH